MKKELVLSMLAASALMIGGCSSDDSTSSGGNTAPATLKAQFVDSPIAGLNYDCQSSGNSGLTDANGYFNYVAGDTCTFKVGNITLGDTQPNSPFVTPRDLSNDATEVTNILRLLQTLDEDETPSNGITITLTEEATGTLDLGENFDAEIQRFLTDNGVDHAVVSAEQAEAHFQESLTMNITDTNFIGKTYTFASTPPMTLSFSADHTVVQDGSAWTVTDNTLQLATSAITLNIDGTAEITTEGVSSVVSYTMVATPTGSTTDGGTGGETTTPTSSLDQALLDLGATLDSTLTTQAIMASGLHFTYGYVESQYDGSIATATSIIKYVLGTTEAALYTYDNGLFVDFTAGHINKSIFLEENGWATTVDQLSFNFNTDGDAVSDQAGNQSIWRYKAYDISGLTLADLNNTLSSPFIDSDIPLSTTSTFSAGSRAYTASFSTVGTFTPYYELSHYQDCTYDINNTRTCTEENGNVVSYYDNGNETPYTSITNFISYNTLSSGTGGYIHVNTNDNYQSIRASFSTTNTLILTGSTDSSYDAETGIYTESTAIQYEDGSYEIKTVGNTEILILTLPEALAVTGEQRIYSMEGGFLRKGTYHYAVANNFNGFFWLNETAALDVFNFIESYNTLPATQTAAPVRSTAPTRSAMRLPGL